MKITKEQRLSSNLCVEVHSPEKVEEDSKRKKKVW